MFKLFQKLFGGQARKRPRSAEPSYWFRAAPAVARFPSLSGGQSYDVVIIGGGMAGVSTAYFLSKAGLRVAVVEADLIGCGDSAYTTGFATQFLETTDATLAAWDISLAAVDLLKKVIREEKIDCDWQDTDAVCFTREGDEASLKEFAETARRFQAIDPRIELLNKSAASRLVGADVSAAFRQADSAGIFHIRKFLLGLSAAAVRSGAAFFENSEVVDVNLGERVTVRTVAGSIAARHLIVASGAPSDKLFPKVANILHQSISYVIDAKFSGQSPLSNGFFWDALTPFHYYRSVGDQEFLLGGEDRLLGGRMKKINSHEKLANWLKDFIGASSSFDVLNSWQGSLFSTSDGLPLIGPHPAYGSNVIFLTGWSGNGTAQGCYGGRIAADLITNNGEAFPKIFATDRTLVWPEINKQNMSSINFDNLEEGKGVIMKKGSKKLAVIKTDGQVRTFSARCPHLGCKVGWNDSEKTWDCPCHGSRFNADGTLLHGPAKRGLDPIQKE